MTKSDSLVKLAPALVAAQKKMGVALKDSKNPFFKSKYADLNAIIDASVPVLNDHGIAVLQAPDVISNFETKELTPVIRTVLLHESGEYIAGNTEIIASKINDPQATGSATTYARRYGLQAMVTLKAEDDDAEAGMGRTANRSVSSFSVPETTKKSVWKSSKPVTIAVTTGTSEVVLNEEVTQTSVGTSEGWE